MRQRSIPVCIILSFVTCGIYGIYWFISLNDDVNYLRGQYEVSGVKAFLFSIITCGIYMLYWHYRMGEKIDQIKTQRGENASSSGILYLLLAIFGLSIVSMAIIQNEVNRLSDDAKPMY